MFHQQRQHVQRVRFHFIFMVFGIKQVDNFARMFPFVIIARIPEPDRTWMALAAYNMGMGHLEDVRIITEKRDMNPDSWADVRENLGLLTQESWYRDTRYGYARGFETKHFVDNIQSYYETLIWMDTREHPLLVAQL